MTYEQLRVLQAVVNEGTFRAAAEKLFKSQPAISNMIKKLEQACGFQILSRDQYRPRLTAEGQVFYEKAMLALNQMHQLTALSRHIARKEEPLVRIAVNAICPMRALLDILKQMDQRYPATQLDLCCESMGGAMERLIDAEVDMAITTQAGMDSAFMEAAPFSQVRILQVARPDYPPAIGGKVNAAADMRGYVQMLVADSSQRRPAQSLDVLQGARHWRVSNFQTNRDIILSGMAWGAMPEHMISAELASGELQQLHVEGLEPRLAQLYLLRRTDKPVGLVADAIWSALLALSSVADAELPFAE